MIDVPYYYHLQKHYRYLKDDMMRSGALGHRN